MAENAKINEDRLKKFRAMGISVLPESLQNTSTVITPLAEIKGSPEKKSNLTAILNGSMKNKFHEIIEKAEPKNINGFKPLPTVKQKQNPNASKSEVVIPLASFSPVNKGDAEARMLEGALFGEDPRTTTYSQSEQIENVSVDNRRIPSRETLLQEEVNTDQYGTDFIQRLKAKRTGIQKTGIQSQGIRVNQPLTVQPHLRQRPSVAGISEVELENKIMEIATDVATEIATEIATSVSKNMIKKVITEYAKDGSGIIVESKNIRKAELVGNGVVKIAGKTYKLTPIKQ